MSFLMRSGTICALTLVVAACGSRSPGPIYPPHASTGAAAGYAASEDPQIARIFGDPPVTGRLPGAPAWSPAGDQLAYLRKFVDDEGERRSELWIHELKSGRERPLLSDKELPVSSYVWAGDERVVVESGGDLYLIRLDGERRQLTDTEAAEAGIQASPVGDRAAFVRDHNLWVIDLGTGTQTQITEDGTAERSYGEVTWVYGEEFDTSAGFGWSPDGLALWLYATDVTRVTHRTVLTDAAGNTRAQPYPRPGDPNPVLRVGVVTFDGKGQPSTRWLSTGNDADVYLPRVVWHPDGKRVVVVRLDRLQTVLELLLCDGATSECEAIMEERDPRWVDLLGDPRFIGDGDSLLWLSERDGFAHIYRVDLEGGKPERLTKGRWNVSSIDAVDEKRGAIYFAGSAEDPLARGIYRVDLDGGRPARICGEGGVHSARFAPDHRHYLDIHSALERIPRAEIFDLEGERVATVAESDLGVYEIPPVANDQFQIEIEEDIRLWAQLTRPRALEPGRRYPVLVYVYGGPGAQVVRDHFRTSTQPWRNLLAQRGILVFSVDGRGSAGRGREFATPIHRRLGEVELADQLAAVKYLKRQPYTDPERVGIFGWSYGGTMVLNALLRTKGVFKAGVSVAPVTDWKQYDTAYTERFMQRPADNAEGYADTSLLTEAGELETPLLLVHGLADDNVHFDNTAQMIDAFVEAGKQLEVMVYPGKAHGIRGGKARTHLFTKITRFFERYL